MAVHTPTTTSADSDYGSDIDDADADQVFSHVESQLPLKEQNSQQEEATTVLQSIGQPGVAELEEDVFTHNFSVRLARLRQPLEGVEASRAKLVETVQRRRREAMVEVECGGENREAFSPSNPEEPTPAPAPESPGGSRKKGKRKDLRSPLQRFKPTRPLSVTNLVSPTWCEQQYEYNLSNYGRIPKTKAMTSGTAVHQELEEQVHVEVPVEVVSREDRVGLKLWNTIQGLRALRETGLTRELEVWGVLEGEVVNGIIDEVTAECPDAGMEARILDQMNDNPGGGKGKKGPELAPGQKTLTDFLTGSISSQPGAFILEGSGTSTKNGISGTLFSNTSNDHLKERPHAIYYIKDIKTTARASPPAHGPYTRGAHIQLMLYHRMLSGLASHAPGEGAGADEVGADLGSKVFSRYRLDPEAKFSDQFISELANLDMRAFVSVPDDADIGPGSQQWQADPLTELLERNCLAKLWDLLVEEARRTFPTTSGSLQRTAISTLLTVEYRSSSSKKSGNDALIGSRSFPMDHRHLDEFVKSGMAWWKGDRQTVGVSVDEAWKCERCEFRDNCEWRQTKVEEGLERARLRKSGLRRSGL